MHNLIKDLIEIEKWHMDQNTVNHDYRAITIGRAVTLLRHEFDIIKAQERDITTQRELITELDLKLEKELVT